MCGSMNHLWDSDGERCLRCGDKDWFAGPECKPPDNGLFQASVDRTTREWTKAESAEWALQAILPDYVNVQDVVLAVQYARSDSIEIGRKYRRAAAEADQLAKAVNELQSLLTRSETHLKAWWDWYGRADPLSGKLPLPPAGGVELAEDIGQALIRHSLSNESGS